MGNQIESMSISLPKALKARIRERVLEDHYGTPSDYLRSLIRDDLHRRDQERLEMALLEGVQSGHGMEIRSQKDWKTFWKTLETPKATPRTKKHG